MPSDAPSERLEGAMHVSVIGSQRKGENTKRPYTVYRTVVTYQEECFERLIRYREFRAFYHRLRVKNGKLPQLKFPSKRWTRRMSMQDDVVEERRFLLNDFMKKVCKLPLTPESEDYLCRLLRCGKHEDVARASDSMFSRSIRSDLPSERALLKTFRSNSIPLSAHEEEDDDHAESEDGMPGATVASITLVDVSEPLPSNSSTIMTMDELSTIEEAPSSGKNETPVVPVKAAAVADPEEDGAPSPPRVGKTVSFKNVGKKEPTPEDAKLLLEAPQMHSNKSLRQKKSAAKSDSQVRDSDPAVEEEERDETEPVTPTVKYASQVAEVNTQIAKMLSDEDHPPPLPQASSN